MAARVLALAILLSTPAWAQVNRADEAYAEGRRLYDLRDWDRAIKKFKEAYELRPDAPSLFNIAQAYRLKGDCQDALAFYRTYRRNYPEAKNIAAVDKFIDDLDPCPFSSTGGEPLLVGR